MADADSSLTPEKKLLKLIEEPAPAGEKAGRKFDLKAYVSPAAIRGRVAALKQAWRDTVAQRTRGGLNLRKVNQWMKFAVGGLALYCVGGIVYEVYAVERGTESFRDVPQREMAELPVREGRTFDPGLFEEIDKRNVFVPAAKRAEEQKKKAEGGASFRLIEMTQNFKLVGISVDPKGAAKTFCMIEDLKKNVTTFLRVGDTISGIRVDEISPDGVVLKYRDEEIELR